MSEPQLTLDGTKDVWVKRCRKWWHPQPCWHGGCANCGETLTAFDYTADEARELAQSDGHHRCPSGT